MEALDAPLEDAQFLAVLGVGDSLAAAGQERLSRLSFWPSLRRNCRPGTAGTSPGTLTLVSICTDNVYRIDSQGLPAGGAISNHPIHGTVRSWDEESGWGVLASPDVPGEVWAHFSAVHATDPGAFISLEPGEAVLFTWEEADQDGFSYRAVQVRRPGGPETDWDNDEDDDDEDAMSDVRIELDP